MPKSYRIGKSKTEKVRKHLRQVGQISSWDAFMKFRATRLSATIYCLRKQGWVITNEKKQYKDEDGITIRYDLYILEHEPIERSDHVTDNEHYSTLPQ